MASETLRPNAAGDETSIDTQFPDETYHWDKVDEAIPDDDTTEVFNFHYDYLRDLYNLPSHSVGSGVVNKITLYFRVEDGGAGNCVKGAIKSGSTVVETAEKAPRTDFGQWTWGTYSQEWTINPDTGIAWTWDEIDALQIGVALKNNANPAACTQIYVEVDYTAVTAKTSSDTGSGTDAKITGNPLATLTKTETGSGADTSQQGATLQGSDSGMCGQVLEG